MSVPAVLGIDLGTGSVKVLVMDQECRVLATAAAGYSVERPHDGWAEQDPNRWWSATVDACRQAMSNAGDVEIAAVSLSGQMHGTVLIGANGQPLRPAIIWEDRRSGAQVRRITETIGAERLIELCGSPIATGFQAATLAWLAEHEPNSVAHASSVLLPADYLRFRMTGELASEPSDASSTLLFDVRRRTWAPDVAAAVGIDLAKLPPIRESTDIAGSLHAESASDLGLAVGIPVAAGGGDAPLAALAASATRSDTLLLTISTGSQAILPAEQPVVDPRGRVHTWCGIAPPGAGLPVWYQMGATLASGRALRWLREDLLKAPTTGLDDIVSEVLPGSDGLLFLPYLNGERTPLMDPDATGMLLGLRAHHGAPELTRAVMEGAVFALFDAYTVLRELGGAPVKIVLAGGGARSRVWTQIVADIFALPVSPLLESEGSAIGASIVAGVAAGWFDLAVGAERSARFGEVVEPCPEVAELYREMFPIFQHAYQVLKNDLHALGDIASRARRSSINR